MRFSRTYAQEDEKSQFFCLQEQNVVGSIQSKHCDVYLMPEQEQQKRRRRVV